MIHVSWKRWCHNPECGIETWDEHKVRPCPVCGVTMHDTPTTAQLQVATERGEIYDHDPGAEL